MKRVIVFLIVVFSVTVYAQQDSVKYEQLKKAAAEVSNRMQNRDKAIDQIADEYNRNQQEINRFEGMLRTINAAIAEDSTAAAEFEDILPSIQKSFADLTERNALLETALKNTEDEQRRDFGEWQIKDYRVKREKEKSEKDNE